MQTSTIRIAGAVLLVALASSAARAQSSRVIPGVTNLPAMTNMPGVGINKNLPPDTLPVTATSPTSSVTGGVWTLGPGAPPDVSQSDGSASRSMTLAPPTTAPPSTQGKPVSRGEVPQSVRP